MTPLDTPAADLEQLGIRTYTTTSPILVKAVQLTEDADWEGIATWCGGRVSTERGASSRDMPVLLVPDECGGWAGRNDWVICGVTGEFFVRSPEEFAATYTPVFNRPPTGWAHDDGGPCDAGFLADRSYPEPGRLWWCTEHQRHLIPAAGLVDRTGGRS